MLAQANEALPKNGNAAVAVRPPPAPSNHHRRRHQAVAFWWARDRQIPVEQARRRARDRRDSAFVERMPLLRIVEGWQHEQTGGTCFTLDRDRPRKASDGSHDLMARFFQLRPFLMQPSIAQERSALLATAPARSTWAGGPDRGNMVRSSGIRRWNASA